MNGYVNTFLIAGILAFLLIPTVFLARVRRVASTHQEG